MSDNTFPPGPGGPGQQPNPYQRPDQPQQPPYGGQPGPQHNPYPGQQPNPYQQRPQPNQPYGGQQPGGSSYGPNPDGQPGGQYGSPQPGSQPYGGQQPGGSSYGQNPHGHPGQYGGQQYGGSGSYGPGQQYGQPPQGPGFGYVQQFEPPKRRGRLIPIIAALAVLMVAGAGGAFAYSRLAGGGSQPADVLPASAVAYGRIDLDPGAGQKVNAIRFMMKFPSVREQLKLTGDKDDLRQKLFEAIKADSGGNLDDVDYEKDVKPWLGDRIGVALVPGADDDKEPDSLVAVQIKDEKEAKAGLDKMFEHEDEKPGVAFADSYAVIAEDQATADKAVADAKTDALSDNQTFRKDMSKLGEQGFASVWADLKGVADLAGRRLTDQQREQLGNGSVAAVLRFDAQYVELKGTMRTDGPMIAPGAANAEDVVTSLPETTTAALAVSDGQKYVDDIWKQLQKSSGGGIDVKAMVEEFAGRYGFTLPDDLKTLLGDNFVVALDKEKPADGLPKAAVKVKTDPAKAEAIVSKLSAVISKETGVDPHLATAKDDDTLVVATSKDYADRVLKGGKLGDTDTFKQAVPDTKGSTMLGFVDFAGIRSLAPEETDDKDFAALKSAGYSARVTGTGEAEFALRVVAN